MLYVKYNLVTGLIADVVEGSYPGQGYDTVRHTTFSMDAAESKAQQISVLTGELYIATDSGPNCLPRFDVVRAPRIGDEVSYCFNGDSYPSGVITKISKSLKRVETSEGKVFYRRKQTGAWLNNGTWALVQGHVKTLNPHF